MMNAKYINSIVTVFLAIGAIVCVTQAVAVTKNTSMLQLQIATKQQQAAQVAQEVQQKLKLEEMVTAKQVVDGLIASYKLPLTSELSLTSVKVAPTKDPAGKDGEKGGEYASLRDYQALLGFMSALSTMPYRLDVRELCLGVECPQGFLLTADLKPKTP